ncbi:MAG: iron-sulfur cluster assembly scaffold protein [Pseudomonadota bacterium]
MTEEIYHRKLVERAQTGRAQGRLERPDATATLDNPLCGDRVTIDLKLADGKVAAAGHKVRGCLLCEAAAAMVAEQAPGRSPSELIGLSDNLRAYLQQDGALPAGWDCIDEFAPVKAVKSRHDCVLLPFRALAQALKHAAKTG